MSDTWTTILALIVITVAIKASGPVLIGGRPLPAPAMRTIALMAPALLAALVVVQTFTSADGEIVVDARAAGVAAAGALLVVRRTALLGAVVVGSVVAALVRAL
ncbi:MAG TPA: AzlD domain-containing protein [Solirubrobacterales bacterium]